MTATLEVNQLSGGRARAQSMVDTIRTQMAGATVVLDCSELIAGTASFADELVKQVFHAGATMLVVHNIETPSEFAEWLRTAAQDIGKTAQVQFQ